MTTVRDPAADARVAAHTGPPLNPEPAVATSAALHGGRQGLRATLQAAAPLDPGTAVVELAAVSAAAAVPKRGCPGVGGGGRHGPRRYGCSGRPARSPHIV